MWSRAVTYVTRTPEVLRSRLQQGLEAVKILYYDLSRINIQKPLGLQAHKVAGHQFAYRPKLIGEFLMSCRQLKLDSERTRFALVLGKFEQCRNESLADCRERQLLDDTHESPQPRSYDLKHLERDFWMLHAVRLKIAARNERNFCILDRRSGRGKWPTIEDWQFRDRLARNIHSKYLLTSAHRRLEDANFALCNDVQAVARLALCEEQLPCTE